MFSATECSVSPATWTSKTLYQKPSKMQQECLRNLKTPIFPLGHTLPSNSTQLSCHTNSMPLSTRKVAASIPSTSAMSLDSWNLSSTLDNQRRDSLRWAQDLVILLLHLLLCLCRNEHKSVLFLIRLRLQMLNSLWVMLMRLLKKLESNVKQIEQKKLL